MHGMGAETLESLDDIGRRHGCDKFTVHSYAPVYEAVFAARRQEPLRVFEIGIGGGDSETGGASLRTWYDYLPNASIIGIDIYNKSVVDNDRIVTRVCDQRDQNALRAVAEEFGPFDVVIDDGSHVAADTLAALFVLFHVVKPGGAYVIEDLQTSYWPHYGGSSLVPDCCDTPVRWLKLCIDIVNRGEILSRRYFPIDSGFNVEALHVHHNIAVLRKQSDQNSHLTRILRVEAQEEGLREEEGINGDIADAYQWLFSDPSHLREVLRLIARLRAGR